MSVQTISILKNIELPIYHINNEFKMKKFDKFPFSSYENGMPCSVVNLYLQSSDNINLSYTKKLLDDKNHCLSYNWNDSSEKTTKYKKYCTHFFNTYFENEIEILNKKIK